MFEPIARFLHLQVWRRLPVKYRRTAFLRLTSMLAPTPTAAPTAGGPIIVVGPLTQASGLGEAARKSHDALKRAGLQVYGVDVTKALMHASNYAQFDYEDGRGIAGGGTVLLHVPGPVVPRALMLLGRSFVQDKKIVAHWFWELPVLPDDWEPAFRLIHEVCANTNFVAEAVRSAAPSMPVHLVSYPLAIPARREAVTRSGQPFTALVSFNVASNFSRKNPCAAIAAFRKAFGDDGGVRLIVKHLNSAAWPSALEQMQTASAGASNIELVEAVFDDEQMDALYDQTDVVMSLHRAEGLGLVIVEAMMRGIPVIATDWSGSTDFFDTSAGVPVPYTLIPIDDPQQNYNIQSAAVQDRVRWAEPDVDAAAEALRTLRADPQLRASQGRAGWELAAEHFSEERYVQQMRSVLGLVEH